MNPRLSTRLLLLLAIGFFGDGYLPCIATGTQSQKVIQSVDAFVESAAKGDLLAVRSGLAAGMGSNYPDQYGTSALVAAAFEGHAEVVRALLEHAHDVDGRCRGWRAAVLSLRLRDSSSAYSGRYPRCGTGTMEEMKQIEATDKLGVTPLMVAAFAGHANIVQILLERGADIEAKSFEGVTPLMFAVVSDRAEVVKLLIARGADVKVSAVDQQSLVMVAACDRGRPVSLRLLLNAGADPNAQNKYGHSPLMGASYANALGIIRTLLERGADVNLKSQSGESALMFAADANNVEAANVLLESGADVNASDRDGSTALMIAAGRYEGAQMTKLLLERGADIRATDNYGIRTALLSAEMSNYGDSVALLRAAGAELSVDAKLLRAAKKGATAMVRELIAEGARVDARGKLGRTALSYASSEGSVETVKALLENGAEPNIYPDDGETPLMEASFWVMPRS